MFEPLPAPAKTHILKVLHRLIDGKPASIPPVATPQGLTLSQEPRADVERHDALRTAQGVVQGAVQGVRHAS